MSRRHFSRRRLDRWLGEQVPLAGLLGLGAVDREDLAWHAHRLVESESFAEAQRVYELLALLWPEAAVEARLGRGVCWQLQGELTEAERDYDEVLDAQPCNVFALANRAEVRLLTRRREAARDDLSRALAALDRTEGPAKLRARVEQLRGLAQVEP